MEPLQKSPRIDRLAVVDEAVASLTQRKLRTALTCLGTVLGVGVLVSVLGLTASAASQIDKRFNQRTATEITVAQATGVLGSNFSFPRSFERRVKRVDGVVDVGLTWTVDPSVVALRSTPLPGAGGINVSDVRVYAATPGALVVAAPELRIGRLFDDYAESAQAPVAVLGPTAASRLGISDLAGGPAITIGGTSFAVIGVMTRVERHPELLHAVIVPAGTALRLWGEPRADANPTGWIEVQQGAGQVVADQVPVAISPTNPERFVVVAPPSARRLQGSIGSDVQGLLVMLAGICLVVGMVGIANTTFVTIMERTGEIGLRRSLGAKRSHIAGQFLIEAAVVGLVGGLVGTFLGTVAVVSVCISNEWTAVLPAGLSVAGPCLGVVTAVLAALYPAMRGAWVDPIVALRSSG